MSAPRPPELLLIENELAAIGGRLAAVTAALHTYLAGWQPDQGLPPAPSARHAAAQEAFVPSTPAPRWPPPAAWQAQPVAPEEDSGEGWAASRVLAWVGGAVTLLGLVFLLVLAAQRGWLSPGFRVGVSAVLGVALIASGRWVHGRPGGRAGGYTLAATGFAALYLDVVAATSLYRYLSVPLGLGAGLAVAAAGLLLADRWRAQPLAVGVVVGCAVHAPMITQRADAALVGFLLLLQVAALPVQLRHGWRGLTVAAATPSVVAALIADVLTLRLAPEDSAMLAAVISVAVLGVVMATASAAVGPTGDAATISVLVASPTPALLAAPLLDRATAGYVAAGVAALLLMVWAGGRFTPALRARVSPRFVAAAGGLGALAALQATMTFVDPSAWATALLCEALVLTVGAYHMRSGGVLVGALCYAAVGFVVALFHEVPPDSLAELSPHVGISGVLVGMLIAVSAIAIPVTAVRLRVLGKPPKSAQLWMLSALLLLYGTASTTMDLALLVDWSQTAFLVGHVVITLTWTVAAIVLLLRGVAVRHLRVAGMVLIAASLAKLFLFDLATLDGFARVVVFLCAGLVLLAAGVRYARLVATDAVDEGRSEHEG